MQAPVNFNLEFINSFLESKKYSQAWWHMPLILAKGGKGRRISVSSRPAWSIQWVLGQSELHRKTLSQNTKNHPTKKANLQTRTMISLQRQSPQIPPVDITFFGGQSQVGGGCAVEVWLTDLEQQLLSVLELLSYRSFLKSNLVSHFF